MTLENIIVNLSSVIFFYLLNMTSILTKIYHDKILLIVNLELIITLENIIVNKSSVIFSYLLNMISILTKIYNDKILLIVK